MIRELDIEEYLKRQVGLWLGAPIYKLVSPSENGLPDRIIPIDVPRRGAGITVWVEVKKPGEKPEPLQARKHERLRKHGQIVGVVDSYESVDNFVDEVLRVLTELAIDGMTARLRLPK